MTWGVSIHGAPTALKNAYSNACNRAIQKCYSDPSYQRKSQDNYRDLFQKYMQQEFDIGGGYMNPWWLNNDTRMGMDVFRTLLVFPSEAHMLIFVLTLGGHDDTN